MDLPRRDNLSSLHKTLNRLCLFKIRQLKLLRAIVSGETAAEKTLALSLHRENLLAQQLPAHDNLSPGEQVLFYYYQILENRLLGEMIKAKHNTSQELREFVMRRQLH